MAASSSSTSQHCPKVARVSNVVTYQRQRHRMTSAGKIHPQWIRARKYRCREEVKVSNDAKSTCASLWTTTKRMTLTNHTLWGHKVRPDLDVLKLDFDQCCPLQLVYGQLSEPIDCTEEHHLWLGSSIQGVTYQTPALQKDFTLVLTKCPWASHTHNPPGVVW